MSWGQGQWEWTAAAMIGGREAVSCRLPRLQCETLSQNQSSKNYKAKIQENIKGHSVKSIHISQKFRSRVSGPVFTHFPTGCTLFVTIEVQRLAPLPSANAHVTREERIRVNCEEPSSQTQGLCAGQAKNRKGRPPISQGGPAFLRSHSLATPGTQAGGSVIFLWATVTERMATPESPLKGQNVGRVIRQVTGSLGSRLPHPTEPPTTPDPIQKNENSQFSSFLKMESVLYASEEK